MRTWALIGLLVTGWAQAQEADYRSGVLVLQDGREIGIRGDYELYGDEVRFTDYRGRLMSLPLAKVDINATNRRNEELRRSEAPAGPQAGGDGLAAEVERWQREKPGEAKAPEFYREVARGDDLPPGEAGGPDEWMLPESLRPIEQKFQKWAEEALEVFDSDEPLFRSLAFAFFGTFILSILVSFITSIYVICLAYSESGLWCLTLLLSYFSGELLVAFGFIRGETPGILFWAIGVLEVLSPILFLIFIAKYCYGLRLRLITLIYSPLIVLALGIAGLFIAAAV